MSSDRRPPRLLLRWEALPAQVQIVIAFPVLAALLFVLHVTLLQQPLARGVFYGLFWGFPATAVVVLASRNEAARRRNADAGDGPSPSAG